MADELPTLTPVLLIEDDDALRETLAEVLERRGYAPVPAHDGADALERLDNRIAAVLLDLKLPDVDGMALLRQIREIDADLPVIVVTGHGSERRAVEALREGAFNYVPKPIAADELVEVVREAVAKRALTQEVHALRARLDEKFGAGGILGNSPKMRAVFDRIRQVASARSTVLITGESGTGKELVAKAIHQLSNRRNRPFVALNCAALPEQLVEDELFGHVKGAFTGAERDRDGRFKQAHNGTLFIDEIGEMAPSTQAKLLRVLETFEFSPVGATNTVKVDVRVLAATNRDLEAEVRAGNFREDLFYRIHVVRIDLPPLRDRTGDIALLVRAFLDELGPANGRPIQAITPEAMQCLEAHDWPGNVRELRNTLEQVIVLSQHDEIRVEDLPENLRCHDPGPAAVGDELIVAPGTPLRDLERAQILRTMDAYDGNRAQVAEVLGISLRTLQRKLKEYGLTRGDG